MRWVLLLAELTVPLGLDPYMHVPKDSPLTKEVVLLGRRLFREKALSRDGTVACESCHEARLAFADGKTVAEGIDQLKGPRNSPTLINRGYGAAFCGTVLLHGGTMLAGMRAVAQGSIAEEPTHSTTARPKHSHTPRVPRSVAQ